MDFELSDEQELLRATVRRFLAEQAPVTPYVRAMLDDCRGTSDAVWRGLADLGLTGLLLPAALGGGGMGMVDMGVVLEEMGRAVHPGPFASSAVAATGLALLAGDTREAALLSSLASGTTIGTVALWEPGRGVTPSCPATIAVPLGEHWEMTGTKVHVPDASAADVVLVTASDADGGLGVFAVERDAAGMTVTETPTVDGTRKQATITLTSAPTRRVDDGDATGAVVETMDRIGVALVLDGLGAAARALDIAVDHAKQRVQFGRPIGSFQAVQHLCADMLRTVELGRAAAYYAAWACDAAEPAERHRAATMALAFAADGFYQVGATAIQVLGGIGFTWEHDAHLYYKRLLTLQQPPGGGAAAQLEELATIVLEGT